MQSLFTYRRSHITPRLRYPTFILFLIVLGFYLYTLAPSVCWADGARVQMDVALGGSNYWFYDEARYIPTDGLPFDHLGVAPLDHPLHVMLGQLFIALPWGELPQRINLFSAVAGALAIALVYQLGWRLVSDYWAAALGALALAVAHTFWFDAVTAEVYTLNVVFMVGLIWLALRWPHDKNWHQLGAFALLAGLGLANHLVLGLTLLLAVLYMVVMAVATTDGSPSARALLSPKRYVVLVEALRGWRGIALVVLFIIGFAPWWVQFVRVARIVNIPLVLEVAVGSPWVGKRLANPSLWSVIAGPISYLGWLLYQFTPVGVALGVYGFVRMQREQSQTAWFLFAIFISHALFWGNYAAPDRFHYYLPSYVAFALTITWGIASLKARLDVHMLRDSKWLAMGVHSLLLIAVVLVPIGLYTVTPSALQHIGVTESSFGVQPIGTGVRDTLRYFLNPNKRGDDSATRFGRSTLTQLAPDALVLTPVTTDREAYVVLRYFQLIEKLRPDVHLELLLFEPIGDDMPQAVLAKVHQETGCRPLYLASLHPKAYPLETLRTEFEIVPEANLYRLLPRQPQLATSTCRSSDWSSLPAEELIRRAMRWAGRAE